MFDWLPDTEDRLREMLDHGLLSERHTVDFKEQLDSARALTRNTPATWPSSALTVAC